jgi:putative membrane protein
MIAGHAVMMPRRHCHSRRVRLASAGSAGLWLFLFTADPALAHMETPVTPENVWRSWNVDPLILVPLVLLAGLYAGGVRSIWATAGARRGVSTKQVAAFAAAIAVLLVALVSPVDQVGGALFSIHMVQHLLLVVVAAPLLVYAAPLAPVLVALPRGVRRKAGRFSGQASVDALSRTLTNPLLVWWAQAIVLWIWHIPAFYEAALRHRWVHMLEHTTFLVTALLFWWLVIQPAGRRRLGLGLCVIFIFAAMIQSSALGALLTFAPSHWYPAHEPYTGAWNLSALEDQQLAGLIMWVPGGLVYLGAALVALLLWFRSMDAGQDSRRTEPMLDSRSDKQQTQTPPSG